MTGKVLNDHSTGILILILPVAAGIILLYKAWPVILIIFVLGILWRLWDTYQWKQWCQQLNPFFNQLVKENQGCLTPMDLSLKTNLSGKAAKRFLERKADEYGAIRKNQGEQGTVYYFLTATALGSIFDESEPEALPESDRLSVAFTSEPEDAGETTSSVNEPTTPPQEADKETKTATEPPSSSFANLAALKEERQQTSDTPQTEPETVPMELTESQEEKRETLEQLTETEEAKIDESLSKGLIQADLAKRLDLNASTVGRRKSDPDFAQWSQSKDPEGIAWKYLRKTKLFIPIEE